MGSGRQHHQDIKEVMCLELQPVCLQRKLYGRERSAQLYGLLFYALKEQASRQGKGSLSAQINKIKIERKGEKRNIPTCREVGNIALECTCQAVGSFKDSLLEGCFSCGERVLKSFAVL